MICPKCGPKPDRPGANPAWIIPAVAEQIWGDITNNRAFISKCFCTYCDHKWEVDLPTEEESFKTQAEGVISHIEDYILCDTLSDQQRAALMEKLKDLWNSKTETSA